MYAFFDNCGHVAHGVACFREPWRVARAFFIGDLGRR